MGLLYEQEIKQDLADKLRRLQDLDRELRHKIGPEPLAAVDVVDALAFAAAATRDCVVCQENHASGSIPVEPETLGQTFLILRAVETLVRDLIAGLIVAAGTDATATGEPRPRS